MFELTPQQKVNLGIFLGGRFTRYKNDRKLLEELWMQHLRQYRGVYDSEILKAIPAYRSKVYPRDSRVKAIGFVAKMMEMMFPVSDKNWAIAPTTLPSIDEKDLAGLITKIEMSHVMQIEQGQQPESVRSEEIETAVRDFATKRARNMEKLCADQLEEIDFPNLCKRSLRSGAIYSYGIVKGPMVRFQEERFWEQGEDGAYKAVKRRIPRPVYSNRKVWDIYPDLGAKSWQHQEGIFERFVATRSELYKFADRKEFEGEVIKKYLREHQTGNYKVQDFETNLREMNNTAQTNALDPTKYEIIIYYGFITAHDLKSLGHEVPKEKMHELYMIESWMLENECIKFDSEPYGDAPHKMYHVFIYGEDEDSGLTGVSLMADMRDSQLTLCALTRMLMDNAASSAGPIVEVNKDLIARGHDIGPIHAFQTVYREGLGPDAQAKCVSEIQIESHITELRETLAEFRKNLDNDSTLPSWTMGQPEKLGEAFRTSNNMSMMAGGATTITKDITRSFDTFVVSVVQSLVDWNMEFSKDENIKGDFQVQARGSRSLVAKEVRGQAIEQFISTLDDEEKALIKKIPALIERMKARDLPYDQLLVDEVEAEKILQGFADSRAAASEMQNAEQQAKMKGLISKAMKDEAMAQEIMSLLEPKIRQLLVDADTKEGESGLRQTKEILNMTGGGGPAPTNPGEEEPME